MSTHILLSKLGRLTLSYKCPECNSRNKKSVPFVVGDRKAKAGTKVAMWCQSRQCEARHSLTYSVKHKQGCEPKFKVVEFSSNEELYGKRFRLLEWSDTE